MDSLKSGYTIGTQIVKVLYRGYEAGMGGGWLYKCSPVLHYTWYKVEAQQKEREMESCTSAVSLQ